MGKGQGRCGQEELCGLGSREFRRVLCYVDLPYMARLSENLEMGIENMICISPRTTGCKTTQGIAVNAGPLFPSPSALRRGWMDG